MTVRCSISVRRSQFFFFLHSGTFAPVALRFLLWQVLWKRVFDHQEHTAKHDNSQYEERDKALQRGEVQQVLSNALLVVLLLDAVVAAGRCRRVAKQRSDL